MTAADPAIRIIANDTLLAWILPYGARLMQLWWRRAPEGQRPLTLGFLDPAAYGEDRMSLGAVCGRYANRIADAELRYGEQRWRLDANHPLGHCIHGGAGGFGARRWTVEAHDATSITLALHSPDGDQGFPGNCRARVHYRLDGDALWWDAQAEVDAPCPLNLLQHSYWNLDGRRDVRGHRLQVDAGHYLPTDARELPLPPRAVDGGCFDFRQPRAIAPSRVPSLDGALLLDRRASADASTWAAPVATLAVDDLALTLSTDRPLLHVYAAANLRPTAAASGVAHGPGAGLCLETEDWPNGPALGKDVWYGPARAYRHSLRLRFQARS